MVKISDLGGFAELMLAVKIASDNFVMPIKNVYELQDETNKKCAALAEAKNPNVRLLLGADKTFTKIKNTINKKLKTTDELMQQLVQATIRMNKFNTEAINVLKDMQRVNRGFTLQRFLLKVENKYQNHALDEAGVLSHVDSVSQVMKTGGFEFRPLTNIINSHKRHSKGVRFKRGAGSIAMMDSDFEMLLTQYIDAHTASLLNIKLNYEKISAKYYEDINRYTKELNRYLSMIDPNKPQPKDEEYCQRIIELAELILKLIEEMIEEMLKAKINLDVFGTLNTTVATNSLMSGELAELVNKYKELSFKHLKGDMRLLDRLADKMPEDLLRAHVEGFLANKENLIASNQNGLYASVQSFDKNGLTSKEVNFLNNAGASIISQKELQDKQVLTYTIPTKPIKK